MLGSSWANVEKDNSVNYNLYGKNTGVYVFVLEGESGIYGVKFSLKEMEWEFLSR